MEEEDGFDAARGTETTGQLLRLNYGATPVRTFRRVLAAIDAPLQDFVFVDLGSGKGRAVILAADLPFKRLIGVERSARLHAVARGNFARVAGGGRANERIELHCADVVDFVREAWPSDDGVLLYLYCPFHSSVLREVRDSILEHPAAREQHLIVAFVNPNENMRAVLRGWPGLRRVAAHEPPDPSLRIYEAFELWTTVPEEPAK